MHGRNSAHLNRWHHQRTLLKGSMYFSAGGGGGVIVSEGGVQPYLRQMAWTSDPEDHLKSLFGTDG